MSEIPISPEEASYATMTKVGSIRIAPTEPRGLQILVEGFEFSGPPTCRMHAIRAMSWARDILDAEIKRSVIYNGEVSVGVD